MPLSLVTLALLFPTADGRHVDPFAGTPTVLVFTTVDCPIANAYVPELNRVAAEYGTRGVRVMLVQVDPDLTTADAAEHAADYRIAAPVLLDPTHRLVTAAGATRTPEAAVYDAGGRLRYRGRIDDRFAGLGDRRAAVTESTLRDALDAVLGGGEVRAERTEVVGCRIPRRRG